MAGTTSSVDGSVRTSSLEAEIEIEQRYVDRVYARLAEMVERAAAVGRDGRARGLLDYTGEIKEDDYRSLFERDVLVDHALRRLAVLDAQREGLVFGRIDLASRDARYVGRIGVRDSEHEPLVIDWRAPAASVFYQATAVEPLGVVRRRVLRCTGQRVVAVDDDLLDADAAWPDLRVVGDGALMAALTAARGRQMRDIVATIQREQDEIIRAPASGATLIGGGPGTGKTVVALHRAAYLLYSDRRRIERGGVLIVGPSPVFMSYIERVLPSLGEHEATLRSVGELVDGVTARRNDPFACAVVKGSLRMRRLLARAARDAVPGAPDRIRLFAGGRMVEAGPHELAGIREEVLRRGTRRNRARPDAVRALFGLLWRKASAGSDAESAGSGGRGSGGRGSGGRGSGGAESGRADFDADLADRDVVAEFVDAWWPVLTPENVLGWLSDPGRLARYAKGLLRPADVELLAASWDGPVSVEDVPLLDELHALLGDPPSRPPARDELDDDDVAELSSAADRLYAGRHRVERPPTYDEYAHVLVDEAQDLSPMQWRMLGRRGRHASWTVVGDPAQSAWPAPAEAEKARDAALGRRARRTFRLSTNYRNSAEIFELAGRLIRRVVPDLDLPQAVRRTDVPPEHVVVGEADQAAAVRAAVGALLEAVEGTVGVVAPVARREQVAGWISETGDPASQGGAADLDRVSVTTGLATKGLEYDGMVVVEPAEIERESPVGTRTLYVVLTRATQRLVTISTESYPFDR